MAEGSMKTYQVEYLITMQDQASNALKTLTTNATGFQDALKLVPEYVKQATRAIQELRNEAKTSLVVTPELNTKAIKAQLKTFEDEAKTVANRIAGVMKNAMMGTASKTFSDSRKTQQDISKEIKAKKDLLKVKQDVGNASEVKAIEKQIKDLQELKKTAPRGRSSSNATLSTYSSLAKEANKLTAAADAIKNINTTISQMGRSQEHLIKVDADISPAVTKINTLLETIRTNVAALPITVTKAGKNAAAGTKGGKAISAKTGKATKVGSANIAAASKGSLSAVENVLKGQKSSSAAVVDIVPKPNINPLVTQLTQSKEKLQAKANESPITFRSAFNGGDAGFQLRQAIASLQELANSKPIVLKSTLATGANSANAGTGESTQTATGKDGKGSVQAGSKWTPATQSQINAYEKHAAQMSEMRTANAVELIKQKYKAQAQLHAERQAMYEQLGGRETLHQRWLERDAAGQSTRAKNIAARQYREAIAKRNAALFNTRQFERQVTSQSPTLPVIMGGTQSSKAGSYGGMSTRMVKPTESLYARSRAFLYPFTGNTSFGARTPMAVDMAKGMGTMFAIGGAMSAVGSSLSQSVNYQNIMKTTQAILENGTKNYSDGGFKQMEQVVRQVGKETKFTAPQVASAAKFLAMAGYDIPSIKSAINPVANIALIGDTNLGETADKLTNVMTTFGINPEKMNDIADIMTSTFTRSNTDMMMLAESAKYAGGIAHLYGSNFQNNFSDVMAMFGALGNAGIQASSAGTTLRMMYQNLMQPNKNQKKTLAHYGINTRSSSGAPLEMIDILKQISEKVPQEQLADAVGNMFRITAQPGAAALVNAVGNGSLINLMEANRKAAGTGVAQSIADEKKNTLQGLWAQVESTFTEGVLQALENREGGWAGELMRLRDYLAKPETIQMLSSIVDMVEQLVKTISTFAKIYAKVYSMFPGLINGWMHIQLLFTQMGYLATPIIQLMSILDRLKISMFGAAAATAAATAAENGKRAATTGATAANILDRGSRYASMIPGRSVDYATAIEKINNRKVYYERKANILRNSVAGSKGERIPISPLWFAPMGTFGKNPTESAKFFEERARLGKYDMGQQLYMSNRAAAQAQAMQDKIDALRAKENEFKTKRFEVLRAARRPEQMANRALIERYASVGGNAALIAQARAQFLANDNAALASGAMSRKEYMQRYGFKQTAKMTWGNSFSAGRALGTLSFASMFSGMKTMALSLFSGLAKAIGLLVSPVGLVTIAIGGLVAMAYKAYKDYKKYQANTKLANENQKRIIQQQKDVNDLYENIGNDIYGIKPLKINLSKREDGKSTISLAKNKIVSDLLDKDKTDKLTGSYIADKYISNFKYLPKNYISDYYHNNKDYTYTKKWDRNIGDYVDARHELPNAKENAIKLGVVAQWAALATKQADVKEALVKVQTAIKNKDFNLAQRIVASYKPISSMSMLTGRDAKAISQIQDPTKYYEWQYAQYQMLQDSLTAKTQASKYSHALDLIKNFKESNKKDKENYDGTALAQTLIQSIPVVINGTKASLNLDKMGRIDWAELAKSVNNGIPFTIGQQADIMGSVYEAIYNDPNVKNVSSVIELLQTYLPQIAHVSNPYDGYSWSDWGEDSERDKQRRDKNIEQTIQVPFAATGSSIANPSWGLPNSIWDVQTPSARLLTNDFNRTISENGGSIIKGTIAYNQKYPDRFPQAKSLTNNSVNNLTNKGYGGYSPSDDKKKQKDYASTYGRNAAKPTQVIINIDKLASFDRTAISKESNDRAITEAIETKIAEAVSMLSAQILTTANATISQGLS